MNRLEALLSDAGEMVAWPDADLTLRVVGSLDRPVRPQRRRRALLAVAVMVLVIASLLAIPTTRQAIADLLGVAGIRVELGAGDLGDVGYDLDLGEPATSADAASALGFAPAIPSSIPLPDQVYLAKSPVEQLHLAWAASPELPEIGQTGVGLLITQFRANGTSAFLKRSTPETDLAMVPVSGVDGFWLEGAPHLLAQDVDGVPVEREVSRLAANVLIWEREGVTYRVESNLSLAETLAIARSMATGS
jgi:hypothetical protein